MAASCCEKGGEVQNVSKNCDRFLSSFFIFFLSLVSFFFLVFFYLHLSFPLAFIFSFPSFFVLRFSLLFFSPCESNKGVCEMEA